MTALVTGGTKGIGKAVVEELAGTFEAKVFTCARNQSDLDSCLKLWREAGWSCDGVIADVSNEEGRKVLMDSLRTWLRGRPLDILVNNVGTNIRKPSIEYTQQDIDTVWKTNYESMFALTVACHDLLKRPFKGGVGGMRTSSVVNIGSVAGVTCMKSGTIYASTKAAMNQVTGNWACEWGLEGIRGKHRSIDDMHVSGFFTHSYVC